MISIIVVSLNTKKKFIRTIKSITDQTYKKKEIIVIDGKSTDGTIKILNKLKNFFFKIVVEKDKGIYDAMNKGSKLASGDWITFMNSGDIFYNKKILSNIFKQKLIKKDIIFGDTLVKNHSMKYISKGKNFTNKTIVMPFCHQSAIVRSEIVKKNKFSLKYKYSSDFEFFIKCFLRKKNFYNCNLIISEVLGGGVSDVRRQDVYNENIKIIKNYNFNASLILKLFFFKFLNLIKDFTKYIFPKFIVLLILKSKYKNKL